MRERTQTQYGLKKRPFLINLSACFRYIRISQQNYSPDLETKPRFILASGSPRRRQLLGMLYPGLSVIPSTVDEPPYESGLPSAYAENLARMKAADVAQHHPNALVIGADTIVVLGGQILGKPADAAHAREMLRSLSGNTHTVISAVCLVRTAADPAAEPDQVHVFSEATQVRFGELTDGEISRYVAGGSPMDKAGAYGIQDDLGALFVAHITGDYYTVVGFPMRRYYTELRHFAPDFLPETLRP